MNQASKVESTLTFLRYISIRTITTIGPKIVTKITRITESATIPAEILGGRLGPFEYYFPLTPS